MQGVRFVPVVSGHFCWVKLKPGCSGQLRTSWWRFLALFQVRQIWKFYRGVLSSNQGWQRKLIARNPQEKTHCKKFSLQWVFRVFQIKKNLLVHKTLEDHLRLYSCVAMNNDVNKFQFIFENMRLIRWRKIFAILWQ